MKSKYRTFTDEQFICAVKNNFSIASVLTELKLDPSGSNYAMFKKLKLQLNTSTDHFTGQGHLKGKTHNWNKNKADINTILTENSSYSRTKLKERLIKEKMLNEKCAICGIINWNDKKLSLHLDHINGINDDNTLSNLRLLCPNCHSQTDTYCGKNKKAVKKFIQVGKPTEKPKCPLCQGLMGDKRSAMCFNCSLSIGRDKITWPTYDELTEMLKTSNYVQVGKQLGVSANAIRYRMKKVKK